MLVKVNGRLWQNVSNFSLSSTLDAVASTFQFQAGPYDPNDAAMAAAMKPLTFPKVQFFHNNGKLISTGTITNHAFRSVRKSEPQLVMFAGYSLGGVLEDCEIPYALYPLESNRRTLKEIANRLLAYFGLKLIVYSNAAKAANEPIEKSVAEPEETVKNYISKIASQKNILFSHDIYGNMILFRPDIDADSKRSFTKENTLEMTLETAGQAMHSEITVIRQPEGYSEKNGDDSSGLTPAATVKNPYVSAKRPRVILLTAGTITNTDDAAHNALAGELQNIRVNISLDRWAEDLSFGDIVEIQNGEINFPKPTRMMVHNISMSEDSKGQNMNIKLVLPESFTAGKPKRVRHDQFQHI